ncbi:hypothetical protein IT403_01800 [Candidatus Nomurabacteria bacterium]|nr:hypothetical protein [Candidatus Nomurabacteria bacterium]
MTTTTNSPEKFFFISMTIGFLIIIVSFVSYEFFGKLNSQEGLGFFFLGSTLICVGLYPTGKIMYPSSWEKYIPFFLAILSGIMTYALLF